MIETQAGDVSAYIPTNVISITDGQIFLETDLFNAGIRPARQRRHHRLARGRRRADQGDARSPASCGWTWRSSASWPAFAQFGSDLDKATRAARPRRAVTEMLKQPQYQPLPVEEQVVIICAATTASWTTCRSSKSAEFERASTASWSRPAGRCRPSPRRSARPTRRPSTGQGVRVKRSYRRCRPIEGDATQASDAAEYRPKVDRPMTNARGASDEADARKSSERSLTRRQGLADASLKEIRGRIGSVKNIAADHAGDGDGRRVQHEARRRSDAGRPALRRQLRSTRCGAWPAAIGRGGRSRCWRRARCASVVLIVITTDRGLARRAEHQRSAPALRSSPTSAGERRRPSRVAGIAVGRKGRDFLVRTGIDRREFAQLGDRPDAWPTTPDRALVTETSWRRCTTRSRWCTASSSARWSSGRRSSTLLPVAAAEMEPNESGRIDEYLFEPRRRRC